MVALLLTFLAGCGQTPAAIKFTPPGPVTVHNKDATDIAKATVVDDKGQPLAEQPKLTWTVTPETVARLEGDSKVVAVGNGEAKIEAKLENVSGSYTFVVALPDKVEIAGYTAGTPVAVGATAALTASLKAGDTAVAGGAITWASDNATVASVDDKGTVMGVADGTAKITATAGELSSTVHVTIGAAAATAAVGGAVSVGGGAPAPGAPVSVGGGAPPAKDGPPAMKGMQKK